MLNNSIELSGQQALATFFYAKFNYGQINIIFNFKIGLFGNLGDFEQNLQK